MTKKARDIILLFGPPLPDKASLIPRGLLAEQYTVISPDDIFQSEPDLGLRDIALRAVDELRKKKQVVISGNNRKKSSRSSLIQTVLKKMPSCSTMIVKLIPKYGLQQILWSQQHATVSHPGKSFPSESQLKLWFDSNRMDLDSDEVDIPTKEEGFDVQEVLVPLSAKSCYKFGIPCLFLQLESVMDEKETVHEAIITVCQQWSETNSCGRIIIVCDGNNVSKGLCSAYDELENVKRCGKLLADKMMCPIYVVHITSALKMGSFRAPPQPGLLAFLQQQHLLYLHDKKTAYIFSSRDHMKMAEAAGVKHIKGNNVWKTPDIVIKGYGQVSPVPEMLKHLQYYTTAGEGSAHEPSLQLPLYEQLLESDKPGYGHCRYDHGLEEHVFVRDWDTFLRYQEQVVTHVTSTSQPDRPPSRRGRSVLTQERRESVEASQSSDDGHRSTHVRSWMIKKPRRESTIESVPSLKKEGSSSRCLRTVYLMSEKEMTEIAKQVLKEAGRDLAKYEDNDPG